MSRQRRGALKAALLRGAIPAAAALVLGLGAAPAALAAPAAPALPALAAGCTQSGATVTCTYTATGEHQFGVPSGVHSVTATVTGGQGGSDFGGSTPGGLGAVATGTIPVTPGQAIFAEVGILGGAAGSLFMGFNDSGAGGGESDVRTCPAAGGGQPCAAGSTLASRLLVAGGGGGSGDFGGAPGNAGTTGNGGDGAPGTDGAHNAPGGGGATVTAPGSGGAGCDGGGAGSPGAAAGGAGGDAGSANGVDGVSGGGGGAGWFGGGAGGGCSQPNDDGGSGGGGTSHAGPSVTGVSFSQAAAGQAPSVIITYTALTITTTSLPGGTLGTAYSATLAATGGTTPLIWSLASGSSLPAGLTLSSDGVISGTPSAAGDATFTVQVADSSSPQQTASQQFDIDVAKVPPHLSLSVLPPSGTATTADPVTLTAQFAVPPGALAPSGSVAFTVDGTSPSGCGSVPVTSGQLTCKVSSLTGGSHTLAVSYAGDSNYTSDSATITGYTVTKAVSVVTVTPSVAAPVSGQGVTFTATVTAGGQPAVGGTVQWSVNGTATGSPVPVAADGTATLGPITLPVGSNTITADYSGSDQDTPGTGTTTITVAKAATKTALTVTRQQMTAAVTPVPPGAGVPTGTVTFSVDGIKVGTAKLSAQGVAVLPLKSTGTGRVTASYSGDNNFTPSSITITVRGL
jgi:hypothetical protein